MPTPTPPGVFWIIPFSIDAIYSAIGINIVAVCFCSVFVIMSHVTGTTTTPSLASVPFASTRIITMMMASTSMGLAAVLDHDVDLLLPLIPRDKVSGAIGLTTVQQQQQPESKMPSQAYAYYLMGPPEVSFLLS